MQRTIEMYTKQKSSQTTKDSRQILEVTTIIREADIIVEEAITSKVDTKIIMEEDQDIGYAIKITIST